MLLASRNGQHQTNQNEGAPGTESRGRRIVNRATHDHEYVRHALKRRTTE